MTSRERLLLYLLMEHDIYRYLISNSYGRENGVDKSNYHISLIKKMVAYIKCVTPYDQMIIEQPFESLHKYTRKLTDNLDKEIGFPLNEQPDYDQLVPLFFHRFIELCLELTPEIQGENK